jgi:hypothetical protein
MLYEPASPLNRTPRSRAAILDWRNREAILPVWALGSYLTVPHCNSGAGT